MGLTPKTTTHASKPATKAVKAVHSRETGLGPIDKGAPLKDPGLSLLNAILDPAARRQLKRALGSHD